MPYPYDHRLWYTDIEPAYEKPAECECHHPPHSSMCMCVTSADVNNWNSAYNAVSSIIDAGIDMSAISSAAQLMSSADYWNSTYETVSSNSAYWTEVSAVSSDLYAASADLDCRVKELSARKIYTDYNTLSSDTCSISGDGTSAKPLGIMYGYRYDELFEELYERITSLSSIKDIYDAMGACKAELLTQIAELSGGHIQNFDLIMQILGIPTTESGVFPKYWISDPNMIANSADTYTGNNAATTLYYSTYTGK